MVQISGDSRGILGVCEFEDIPFNPVRAFWITEVPLGGTRGHHAHHRCHQFLIPMRGNVVYETRTRNNSRVRDQLSLGDSLYLPPEHWIVLSEFSADCSLLVLCSRKYEEFDYIKSLEEFLS